MAEDIEQATEHQPEAAERAASVHGDTATTVDVPDNLVDSVINDDAVVERTDSHVVTYEDRAFHWYPQGEARQGGTARIRRGTPEEPPADSTAADEAPADQ